MTYMYVILNISLVSKKLCFCKCCVTNWQNKILILILILILVADSTNYFKIDFELVFKK